jgi:putative aldouronate transport system permease protein
MFVKIALPLAAPIIAVMALFYGVGHWNQFFNALIYISNRELYPLQLVLRNILLLNQTMVMDLTTMTDEQLDFIIQKAFMAETMKYALIFVATFPILAVYPFIQKYFDQGIMVGALKG